MLEPPTEDSERAIPSTRLPQSFSERLKQAAEFLTILAVASYALGFVIVNSHLLTYGYSGAGLFKVKYISAGLLFLLLTSLIGFSFSAIFWARIQKNEHESNKRKAVIWAPAFAMFILTQVFIVISDKEIQSSSEHPLWPTWVSLGLLAFLMMLMGIEASQWKWKGAEWLRKNPGLTYLLLMVFYLLHHMSLMAATILGFLALSIFFVMWFVLNEIPIMVRFKEWPTAVIHQMSIGLLFFLFMVGTFGTYLYGHILPQYGGGEPARVRVVLAKEKRDQLKQLGYEENEALLADTLLIDSTDSEHLFLIKKTPETKGLLLQIKKDLVEVMLYYPASL